MILRGTNFGPILDAAGVRGFFGEGYLHHKLLGPFGPKFDGCTFVAKTTTLNARQGNMPLNGIRPKEWKPKCIKVYFQKGIMLNAVGLSGPGAKFLFETGRWQKRTEPFFLSFMSVENSPEERIAELKEFVKLFAYYLPGFKAKVGLQINYSCPNAGLDPACLVDEVKPGLQAASVLGIPIVPKFNILASVNAVKKICDDPNCDAICVSNTIPWGKIPDLINWKKIFGTDVSPLFKFGGGGLSGEPLLLLVANWILEARRAFIKKPINAGGGILSPDDLHILQIAGASSVFLGSVATLRPWRFGKIIQKAHQLFKKVDIKWIPIQQATGIRG
jgi:dihydroorotate dehydrogenase